MKTFTKIISVLTLGVLLMGGAQRAMAMTTLTVGDSYYLGSIADGIPSSTPNETSWLGFMVGMSLSTTNFMVAPGSETIIRSGNDFGLLPAPVFSIKLEDGGNADPDPTNIDFTNPFTNSGYYYVLGKYGAGQRAGQITHAWVIRDLAGMDIELPGQALSHITLFNARTTRTTVPDGGATVLLMGLGTLAIGFLRGRQSM